MIRIPNRIAARKKINSACTIKSHSPLRQRLRRKLRKHFGPKQVGLKPAFKDGLVFHSQVRVGKRGPETVTFPKGKPRAIVATKFRTMKRGAHKDFGKKGRTLESEYAWLGKRIRKTHLDELPQAMLVLRGELLPFGVRILPKSVYRQLPEELREAYDLFGPGAISLAYLCKSDRATYGEYMKIVRSFLRSWKKNRAGALIDFGKRLMRQYRPREIPIEDILKTAPGRKD